MECNYENTAVPHPHLLAHLANRLPNAAHCGRNARDSGHGIYCPHRTRQRGGGHDYQSATRADGICPTGGSRD